MDGLRYALDRLVPVYQPIVWLNRDGKTETVGYEVLSRFPERGYRKGDSGVSLDDPVIDPEGFYKKVWDTGLGIRAKRTLFERVTRDLAGVGVGEEKREKKEIPSLWFNVTTIGLACPTVHELVAAFCFNFPRTAICFEIHEGDRLGESEIAVINSFRSRGVRIALDDWGSPESDRTRKGLDLRRVGIDVVKLDRTLLINPERLKREVKRLRESGVKTILTEGIESDRDLELVRSFGIEMGQGYYFGKPSREIVGG
jgi:EAL domain-containing protein (putative c-di-GMP-specific phosphodiesterase class I)